jgi:hypothetical protein
MSMTLAEIVATAQGLGLTNAGEIAAWANAPERIVSDVTETRTKSASRATLEAALRAILDGMGLPTPLPPGTLSAMLATTPQSDAHRDALSRAIAIRSDLKSAEHGLADADFLASHFGQPTYEATVQREQVFPGIAETHLGREITDDDVRTVLTAQPV